MNLAIQPKPKLKMKMEKALEREMKGTGTQAKMRSANLTIGLCFTMVIWLGMTMTECLSSAGQIRYA